MESFIVVKELATTAYSKILKCKNKKTKEIVVLKILHEKKTEESPSKVVLREITSLYNLKHPNVFIDYKTDSQNE
jgi:serine/threonine protein kinase